MEMNGRILWKGKQIFLELFEKARFLASLRASLHKAFKECSFI